MGAPASPDHFPQEGICTRCRRRCVGLMGRLQIRLGHEIDRPQREFALPVPSQRIPQGPGRWTIPAVIYGRQIPAKPLELDAKEFDSSFLKAHSEIILVDLTVTRDTKPARLAIVQDVQHHPLTGPLHVDLTR